VKDIAQIPCTGGGLFNFNIMEWIKTSIAVPPTKDTDADEGEYYRMSEPVFTYALFDGEMKPCEATYIEVPERELWVCWVIDGEVRKDRTFDANEIEKWMPFPEYD